MNIGPAGFHKLPACLVVISLLLLSFSDGLHTSAQDEYTTSESTILDSEIEFLVLQIPDSVGEGFEPHILVGPGTDGSEWLYIDSPTGLGSQLSGNLWISKDGGYTWDFKETGRPPINYGGSGDSYTAIFSDGTIVFTDLYLITVTVDTSLDGGDTWIQNPQASVRPIDDRQWLDIGPTVGFGDPETLYLTYNQIPGGLYIQKSQFTRTGLGWIAGNGGLPVSTNVGSRDHFVVDKNDGTLYLPNMEGRNLIMYISTDGANTFSSYSVMETLDDIKNIFIAADVDTAGNVYLAWCDKADIFMAVSADRGATWDITKVTQTLGARTLPWITGGDPGRVGLTWYESATEGDCDNTEEMVNATWDMKAAICIDALADNKTFLITTVHENVHTGTIKTTGASSDDADRDLGDFFTCDVDGVGRLVVTYGMDGDDGPNARQSVVMFAKQMEGPFLRENVGPVANFSYETDGLIVKVDAERSFDFNDKRIEQYIWDWGDGTNMSVSDPATEHMYNKTGNYNITLKVVNEDGLSNRTAMEVTVEEIRE
ncbi:MAG: PKD domain-containing protein, partial [Thermoplasmata archaeon]